MPRFNYKAKEGPGKILDGIIEAHDISNAINKVTQLGLTPIDIVEAGDEQAQVSQKEAKKAFRLFKRINLNDKAVFTRQVSDLVEASVPILRTLKIVSNQTQNPNFKELIIQMHSFVKDGGSFSGALSQHSTVFSTLYVEMVKTGEISGKLGVVLERLAGYLEKEKDTLGKIRASLAYPLLILIVGIVTIFILLAFVIPRISIMFEDLDQALPLPTIILTNVSGFFAQYWWLIIGFVVILGVYLNRWLRSSNGRMWFDGFILRVPLLGDFVKAAEIGVNTNTWDSH